MKTRISDAAVEAWASRHGLSSRTLRQAYEEAALPHMQQAEGGDTRGLAEHITDHLCHHEYDIGGRKELLACVTEALAARQTVGQEPVGTIRDRDGVFEVELSESAHDTDAGALDGRSVYLAPPAQAVDPEGVADVLRELLGERNHRTEGDLVTLAKRCRHLSRGDRDLIAMRGTFIEKLMQRTESAQAVDLGQLRALADRWATDRSYSGSPSDDLRALIDGSKAVQS